MRFNKTTYILVPKKGTVLRTLIEKMNLAEEELNAVFAMCYYFFREYVLDSSPHKTTSKTYPLHSDQWNVIFGSKHRKVTRDLITKNDKHPHKQPLTMLLYTNGSYVPETTDLYEAREMEYRLGSSFFKQEWEITQIPALYSTRKPTKSKKTIPPKFTTKQWGERVRKKYHKLLNRTTMNQEKVEYLMERISPTSSTEKVQILTCDALNYNTEDPHISRSEKVHRLYCKLSLMKSELRYALELDGEPTTILDVKSCSAYMVLPLILDKDEKQKWLQWLENGFYESFIRDTHYTRDNIKDGFTVWQGGEFSKGYSKYVNSIIQEEFPKFHSLVMKNHTINSKWLSYYCQRMDSKIIVDGIVLNPNAGFESISIHDALFIKTKDTEKALQALCLAFQNTLGVIPRVEVEDPLEAYPEVITPTTTSIEDPALAFKEILEDLNEEPQREECELDRILATI